jgi:signal transduction histidine kinase
MPTASDQIQLLAMISTAIFGAVGLAFLIVKREGGAPGAGQFSGGFALLSIQAFGIACFPTQLSGLPMVLSAVTLSGFAICFTRGVMQHLELDNRLRKQVFQGIALVVLVLLVAFLSGLVTRAASLVLQNAVNLVWVWLFYRAMRLEPSTGHGFNILALCLYPVITVSALAQWLPVVMTRTSGFVPFTVTGLVMLATSLLRTNRRAKQALAQRELAQEALATINATLEAQVAERTANLQQANQELSRTLADLRQAQDKLLQSEKLASLGALVAGISHELNTPIGNSLVAITTLQDHVNGFEKHIERGIRRSEVSTFSATLRSGYDVAVRNLERAATLVDSFKSVAVDQVSEQRREFTLSAVITNTLVTLGPLLRPGAHQARLVCDPHITMTSYPGALSQVLTNLVQNAVVHGLDGRQRGEIEIAAERVGDAHDQQVRIQVRDNGCGIAPELQKRIFDPFFTTRLGQGGSGLGLAIVHNLVVGPLGGRITVQCPPSGGSCFCLELTLNAPAAIGATAPNHGDLTHAA